MKLTVGLLGVEVFSLHLARTRPPASPPPAAAMPAPEQGLTEDGAPKVHETHTAAQVQLGFTGNGPWQHVYGETP